MSSCSVAYIFLFQVVRRYITMVPAYMVALMLTALSAQLTSVSLVGLCLPFNAALGKARTFWVLVPLPTAFECFAWPYLKLVWWPAIDDTDTPDLRENLCLRLALYLAAYGICVVLGMAFTAVAVILGFLLTK